MNFTNTTNTYYNGDNNDIIVILIILIVIAIIIICCVKNGGCDNEPHNRNDIFPRAQLQLRRTEGPFIDI